MSLRFVKGLLLCGAAALGTGCQSFRAAPEAPGRTFQVETTWVRSTGAEAYHGHPIPQLFQPLLYKDLVIAGNSYDKVAAYRRDTGAEVWRLPVTKGTGPAALYEDHIYFGTLDGALLAVSADTGALVWKYSTGAEAFSAPAVDSERVYFLASDGRLHTVSRQDGSAQWSLYRPSPSTLTLRASGTPLLDEEHVAVGFPDGSLVKMDRATGGVIWERRFDTGQRFQDVDSSPILLDGHVFVSTYETGLYCLNWDTGDLVWTFHEGGPYAVVPHGSHLFYVSERERTYKIEPATGKAVWYIHHEQDSGAPPATLEGSLVQGLHSGTLLFHEAVTGRELARLDLFSGLHSAPTPDETESSIYLMSGFGNLYKIRAGWKVKQ